MHDLSEGSDILRSVDPQLAFLYSPVSDVISLLSIPILLIPSPRTTRRMKQNELGLMYYYGLGVIPNKVKALQFFKKAAEAKHSDGLYNFGMMIAQTDPTSALQSLRSSAGQGRAAVFCPSCTFCRCFSLFSPIDELLL